MKEYQQERRGQLKVLMNVAETDDQRLFTENYMPPIMRVEGLMAFPAAANAIRDALTGIGKKPAQSEVELSLKETLLLNPNADLNEGGKFHVKPEHKGLLLESLVKTVIGNTPTLSPKDFDETAKTLADGRLFEDGASFPADRILTPIARLPGREIGDTEENYWASDRTDRPDMAPDRGYWWQAEHDLITRILNQHAAPAQKGGNLEVGAGWGDFHWLAPKKFTENMVSIEWNPNYIREFRQRFPQADVRQGNVYQLAFPAETFNNVAGFTPFSSLWYLDHAIAELWRVMKPSARFFSFQDLIPNDQQVVDQLLKRGLVADPDHVLFFRTERDRREVSQALSYVGNEFGGPEWKNYKRVLHQKAVVQNLYEYHEQWLATELKYRGFTILHQKDETELYIGPREDRHRLYCPRCSMDHNRDVCMFAYGNPRGPFKEPHPGNYTIPYRLIQDDIVEKVVVWTFVAEKPKGV